MGGDHASTHVGVDVLEGPNAVVIIAQKDLGTEGDVSFDTVRSLDLCEAVCCGRLPPWFTDDDVWQRRLSLMLQHPWIARSMQGTSTCRCSP